VAGVTAATPWLAAAATTGAGSTGAPAGTPGTAAGGPAATTTGEGVVAAAAGPVLPPSRLPTGPPRAEQEGALPLGLPGEKIPESN
jgi:hypothetical protein